jgi:hypothetical protein
MKRSLAAALLVACTEKPAAQARPTEAVVPREAAAPVGTNTSSSVTQLPIAARSQAPESPPSGWCGETAIQEGLLHLGAWASQRAINRAGRPVHPDLYSPEIPIALTELGVRFAFYQTTTRGYAGFAAWSRKAVDDGDPVLAGVKILPTAHPEWSLDHFVLVVGYGDKGLLVNTTWGSQRWVGDTTSPGLSLRNAFYGIRLLGLVDAPPRSTPARLTIVDERADVVKLEARCSGLGEGIYRIAPGAAPVRAENGVVTAEIAVDATRRHAFYCVAAE